MSLYDDLGLDTKDLAGKETKSNISGWGSNVKLLQTHKEIQAKKASLINIKKRGTTTSVAPVVDLRGRGNKGDAAEVRFNPLTGKMERIGASNGGSGDRMSVPIISGEKNSPVPVIKSSPFIATDGSSSFLGVSDEYDPLCPNEFETYMKEVREKRARENEERRRRDMEDREKRRRERHKERGYNVNSDSDGEGDDRSPRSKRKSDDNRRGGAAIAPPPCILEEEPAPPTAAPIKPVFGNINSVASKIMAKMGYKSGEGLGRDNQGMSMALQVEKTSKRGGKIIHERDIQKVEVMPPPPPAAPAPTTNLLRNPTKVVLLRNMVGPGEVDDDLEAETTEECSKYGKIVKCTIFQMENVVEEEAVRIFLEFEKMESAIKAVIDLNGRYFAGRLVSVCFFNLDKFRRLELSDPIDTS